MSLDLPLAFAAIAMGGLLKGATGAGAPVIAVPVLAMLYDVTFAVAIFVVPNLITNVWQTVQYRHERLPDGFTWAYAGGGAVGVLAGTYLLATAAPRALMLTVAGVVFLYIGFRVFRPHWALAFDTARRLALPVGALGGLLQGAAGVSAPVSVTFLNAMKPTRAQFIGTISIFFALTSVIQIPAMAGFGLLTWDRVGYSLLAVLPLLGFMPVGGYLARHISRENFDRAILMLLALIALRLVWVALT